MAKTNKYENYTREELIDELEVLKKKKYGLVWDKKNSQELIDAFVNWENVPENFTPKQFPVLKEVKNKEIENCEAKPVNLLIEGDNYHSLAVLNFTHKSKIDVIYIDPPYNTGNKDFIYNDKFVDKDDPWRHSKWLSFMEKRLRLAHRLLKKTGVIFISIDDNEQGQLKLLCDEIFGEENFYAQLTWKKKSKPTNMGEARFNIQQNIEYILVYGKESMTKHPRFNLYFKEAREYKYGSKLGKYRVEEIVQRRNIGSLRRNTMIYSVLGIKPKEGYRWQLSQKRYKQLVRDKKIKLINKRPYEIIYDSEEDNFAFDPFWSHFENIGTAESGKMELNQILGINHEFETVKPVNLIKKIIFHSTDQRSTVLDFFTGSGTTGQAVLDINNKDNGSRKFILCTNNQEIDNNGNTIKHKICSDICYPRIEKVINGYKNSKGKKIDGLGGNLKYFKTDFVGAQPTDKNKRDLVNKSAEMICIKENIFDLVDEQNLNFKIYQKGKKYLGIVFNEEAIEDFKKASAKFKGQFIIYCFSYIEAPPEKEFADFKNKHTIKPIPEMILRVYREIFKK